VQGKTQLFRANPIFFGNRLTQPLEVAQIAKSIAIKLNYEHFDEAARRQAEPTAFRIADDLVGHNGGKAVQRFSSSMILALACAAL